MSELLKVRHDDISGNSQYDSTIPDYLCSEFEKPDKKEAIKEKQTRFIVHT